MIGKVPEYPRLLEYAFSTFSTDLHKHNIGSRVGETRKYQAAYIL